MRVRSWRWVCAWPWPPSLPNTSHGRPSRSASAGISVCSGIFARPERVRVAGVEVERRAAVVEVDPPLVDAQPAARAEEVRLDEAHEQAVAVGGVHVDRAALRREARREALRARRIDPGAPVVDPVVGEQRLGVDGHRRRVAEVRVAVGERELHRLDQQVLAVGPVGTEVEAVRRSATPRARRRPASAAAARGSRCRAPSPRSGSTHAPSCAATSAGGEEAAGAVAAARRSRRRSGRGSTRRARRSASTCSVRASAGWRTHEPAAGAPYALVKSWRPKCSNAIAFRAKNQAPRTREREALARVARAPPRSPRRTTGSPTARAA